MTKSTSESNSQQKDNNATTKLAKLYAKTLALRALRWKTAKAMAPIITRMVEDSKALVALKAELTKGVEAVWGKDDGFEQYECTTRLEPRGSFNDQLESVGEIEVAGLDDIDDSLNDIADEVLKVAEAAEAPKLPDEPHALKDYNPAAAEAVDECECGRSASVIVVGDE